MNYLKYVFNMQSLTQRELPLPLRFAWFQDFAFSFVALIEELHDSFLFDVSVLFYDLSVRPTKLHMEQLLADKIPDLLYRVQAVDLPNVVPTYFTQSDSFLTPTYMAQRNDPTFLTVYEATRDNITADFLHHIESSASQLLQLRRWLDKYRPAGVRWNLVPYTPFNFTNLVNSYIDSVGVLRSSDSSNNAYADVDNPLVDGGFIELPLDSCFHVQLRVDNYVLFTLHSGNFNTNLYVHDGFNSNLVVGVSILEYIKLSKVGERFILELSTGQQHLFSYTSSSDVTISLRLMSPQAFVAAAYMR